MDTFLSVANLLVNFWLLIILHRRGVRKQVSWFVCYVLWEVFAGAIELAVLLVGRQLYGPLYWWMETVEIALIVAAVRESFLRIFGAFTSRPGFRWSVWGVIGAVVIYSAWKAVYAPPVAGNKVGVFEVGAEFLFRWAIFGIALLTAVMGAVFRRPLEIREEAVVTGFGAASLGFLIYVVSFSLFGTKHIFLARFAPPVGYFVAVFWWIWVFLRPTKERGLKELGVGPDEVSSELRRYRKDAEEIVRKPW